MSPTDDYSAMFEDSQEVVASDDALKRVSTLAEKLLEASEEIKALEESLKAANERLKKLQEVDLPQAMDQVGMKEFKLTNGRKVSVKDFVHANIPKARADEAFSWLRDNGHGDLIKNEVSAKFGRGQEEQASKLMEFAQAIGIAAEQKSAVAWNTLTAWAKEQLADGNPIPMDMLGVYMGRKAEVK